jgi:hypothetical protein
MTEQKRHNARARRANPSAPQIGADWLPEHRADRTLSTPRRRTLVAVRCARLNAAGPTLDASRIVGEQHGRFASAMRDCRRSAWPRHAAARSGVRLENLQFTAPPHAPDPLLARADTRRRARRDLSGVASYDVYRLEAHHESANAENAGPRPHRPGDAADARHDAGFRPDALSISMPLASLRQRGRPSATPTRSASITCARERAESWASGRTELGIGPDRAAWTTVRCRLRWARWGDMTRSVGPAVARRRGVDA